MKLLFATSLLLICKVGFPQDTAAIFQSFIQRTSTEVSQLNEILSLDSSKQKLLREVILSFNQRIDSVSSATQNPIDLRIFVKRLVRGKTAGIKEILTAQEYAIWKKHKSDMRQRMMLLRSGQSVVTDPFDDL